jgi:hypothetical protein
MRNHVTLRDVGELRLFSLTGGLTLALVISFKWEQQGPVARCLFIERDKERKEWAGIFAWGLLSWPWTHYMA